MFPGSKPGASTSTWVWMAFHFLLYVMTTFLDHDLRYRLLGCQNTCPRIHDGHAGSFNRHAGSFHRPGPFHVLCFLGVPTGSHVHHYRRMGRPAPNLCVHQVLLVHRRGLLLMLVAIVWIYFHIQQTTGVATADILIYYRTP